MGMKSDLLGKKSKTNSNVPTQHDTRIAKTERQRMSDDVQS